jgi:HlyD family secretion protein
MALSTEQLQGSGTASRQSAPQPTRPKAVQKKRKRRTGLIFGAIVLILVLVIVALVVGKGGDDAVVVETTTVAPRDIIQTVVATGVIEPETQVKISPEVSGEIIFLGVKEGDHVNKGQVLVRINPESASAQLDQQQAMLAAARSRKAQAEANLLRAEQEYARLMELKNKNLATAQELETGETQVKVNKAEVQAAQYQIQQNLAALRQLQVAASRTTIVAPISGIVTKLNSKLGEKVVGAIQMTGTEIMTIADLSVIEAVVDVSETDVVQVHLGDPTTIEVDAIKGQSYDARVTQISNSPKQSGMGTQEQITNFEVRLRFTNPDQRFRPGMTATATVQTARKNNVLAVPILSVTTRQKDDEKLKVEDDEDEEVKNLTLEQKKKEERPKPVVFVKQGDSVVIRDVQTGIRDDQYMEITSGLKSGEVVVSGSYKVITKELKEGTKIRVEDEKEKKSLTAGKK